MNRANSLRAICLALMLPVAGCAELDKNIASFQKPVVDMSIGDAADISALDLARAMHEAGFSRQEILDYGPGIRNSLATAGAAQVRRQGQVLAMVSVFDGKLYLVTRTRGTLVYPLS